MMDWSFAFLSKAFGWTWVKWTVMVEFYQCDGLFGRSPRGWAALLSFMRASCEPTRLILSSSSIFIQHLGTVIFRQCPSGYGGGDCLFRENSCDFQELRKAFKEKRDACCAYQKFKISYVKMVQC